MKTKSRKRDALSLETRISGPLVGAGRGGLRAGPAEVVAAIWKPDRELVRTIGVA